MNRPAVNYHGLLGLLQTYEKDHKLVKASVNVVGAGGARRRPFKKGKKKKKVQGAPAPSGQTKGKGKGKTAESKADCFFCKKRGHWKRNCPQYLATLDPNRPSKKKK